MKNFNIFGMWNGSSVNWETPLKSLSSSQRKFVKQCIQQLKDLHQFGNVKGVAMVGYANDEDFIATIMLPGDGETVNDVLKDAKQALKDSIDEANEETEGVVSGTIYSIDELCEFTEPAYRDMMRTTLKLVADGGIYTWPNSGYSFKKVNGGYLAI